MTNKITTNFDRWREHEAYMTSKGFVSAIPIQVNMFEGRQWVGINSFPPGVKKQQLNFIDKTISNKASNILSQNITLMFKSERPQFDNSKFNNFVKSVKTGMEYIKYKRRIVKDSMIKGTGFCFFYFDPSCVGMNGLIQGAIKMIDIDILNFACSNPTLKDIQKQKWIMFRQKESIKSLREQCEIKDNLDLIKKDSAKDAYNTESTDSNEAEMIWSYTRMFRINGEVYFEKSTERADLFEKPRPYNPYLVIKEELQEKSKIYSLDEGWYDDEKYVIDPQIAAIDSSLEAGRKEYRKSKNRKFSLYPVTCLAMKTRNNSIYGISEVEGLIPSQIFVNFTFTMFGMDVQNNTLGAVIVKDKALRGQQFTNVPGKTYTDYSVGNMWGIKRLEGYNPMSSGAMETILKTIDISRDLSSSKDLITSENVSKDMSGYLYALLSADANKPLNDMVEELKNWEEDNGRVIEQFVKFFCDKQLYQYELNDKEMYDLRNSGQEVNKINSELFSGEDYIDTDFIIQVEAGQGYKVSEANTMQMIQTLFMNNNWDSMSIGGKKFFLKFCPQELLPFKDDLEVELMKEEQSELAQKEQEIQRLQALVQKADQTIQSLSEQNKYISDYVKSQNREFINETKAKDNVIESQKKAAELILDGKNIGTPM